MTSKVSDMKRMSLYMFDDLRDLFDAVRDGTEVPVWRLADVLLRAGLDTLLRDPDRVEPLLLDNEVDHDDQAKLHQVVAKWWEEMRTVGETEEA